MCITQGFTVLSFPENHQELPLDISHNVPLLLLGNHQELPVGISWFGLPSGTSLAVLRYRYNIRINWNSIRISRTDKIINIEIKSSLVFLEERWKVLARGHGVFLFFSSWYFRWIDTNFSTFSELVTCDQGLLYRWTEQQIHSWKIPVNFKLDNL